MLLLIPTWTHPSAVVPGKPHDVLAISLVVARVGLRVRPGPAWGVFCETGHTVGRSALQWKGVADPLREAASALKKWARDHPVVGSSARPAPA